MLLNKQTREAFLRYLLGSTIKKTVTRTHFEKRMGREPRANPLNFPPDMRKHDTQLSIFILQ
jgi:hypothetical protein